MRTQHQPSHGPWPPFSVVRTGPTFFFWCHAPCNALQPPAVRDGDGFLAWAQSCDHASRRHNVCRRNHAPHARPAGTDKLSLPDWLFRRRSRVVARLVLAAYVAVLQTKEKSANREKQISGERARAQDDDTAMSAAGRLGHLEAPLVGSSVRCDPLCTSEPPGPPPPSICGFHCATGKN